MDRHITTKLVKELAYKYGFARVGASNSVRLTEHEQALSSWLDKGYQGEMNYMSNHFEKRLDPKALVQGAKSVISLAYNYYSTVDPSQNDTYKVSRYAYGKDYHKVIKNKIKQLIIELESRIGPVNGRIFVDSAPVLERAWAVKSGIGWVGKNTLLIHPKMGSYFFLAEIISDIDIVPDSPISDFCGTCRSCIDACPTNAIDENGYVVNGSKCISYATIELKADNVIPDHFKGKMKDWIFGCDICQEVCPWNKFSSEHEEELFNPKSDFLNWSKTDWERLNKDQFVESFPKSPLKRTKFEGLMRNIDFINH